jgi:hypothetical protein
MQLPVRPPFWYTEFMAGRLDFGAPKKRGRPPGRSFGSPITVRLSASIEAQLSIWISRQPEPGPSRPEAVRRILAQALGGNESSAKP